MGQSRAGEPSDIGRGISLADSGADIEDFQFVTEGDRITAVRSQKVDQVREIYLLEFDGAV
ncbi:MAG: hypothetical protein AB8B91_19445 [Rubripirellula sp.]